MVLGDDDDDDDDDDNLVLLWISYLATPNSLRRNEDEEMEDEEVEEQLSVTLLVMIPGIWYKTFGKEKCIEEFEKKDVFLRKDYFV